MVLQLAYEHARERLVFRAISEVPSYRCLLNLRGLDVNPNMQPCCI